MLGSIISANPARKDKNTTNEEKEAETWFSLGSSRY